MGREKKKLKVLMELRPALEGFAGIPQETRLLFSSFNRLEKVEATGLIIHPIRRLWPGLHQKRISCLMRPHRRAHRLSRLALSVKTDPIKDWWVRLHHIVAKHLNVSWYSLLANLGMGIRIYDFDATDFGDFIWQSAFAKTLPAREYEMIRNGRYASIQPSWELLNKVSMNRMRMVGPGLDSLKLKTGQYDIFLAQTPFPCSVAHRTQLVVRYHDAIPIFLPHTISNSRIHQHVHMANLIANYRQGLFACNSEATRSDLLKIYPQLESRSVVIPDIVSHEYYEETGATAYLANIIRNHICPDTEPKFLTSREKENFYHRHLGQAPPRYLLMVSTLEPRKNHSKLIAAWDYLKNHGMSDLKLIIVGERGWEYTRILEAMAPWQQRGELFHLHRIPSGHLRVLYRGADAVICPSVAEGFDLSGIEAMLCGGAVVASDIPVHREIYRDACRYFNPYSSLDQAKAIENVIHPEKRGQRQELIEAGLKHAVRYKRENIEPYWHEFFEKIRAGEFNTSTVKVFVSRFKGDAKPAVLPELSPYSARSKANGGSRKGTGEMEIPRVDGVKEREPQESGWA